jgi:hypothetical protein
MSPSSPETSEQDAKAQLTAIVAAIDACPEDIQVPMLRMFLDQGLDQLQWLEDGFYDFLAECALLAGHNMQDVRLQELQERVEELENPEAPSTAEVLTEIVIMLAVELALVGLVHVGAGALLLYVGQRVVSQAARRSLRAAEKELKAASSKLSELKEKGDKLQAQIDPIKERIRAFHRYKKAGATITNAPILVRLNAEKKSNDKALQLARRALNKDSKSATKAVNAFQQALSDPATRGMSTKWKDFVDHALTSTALGRVGESAGEVAVDLNALSDTDNTPGFASYKVIGVQLSAIRDTRMAAADEYSSLRHYLRSLDDEGIHEDERAQDLSYAIVQAVPALEARQMFAELIRPAVVEGYELVLWYEWLATSGMLSVDPGKSFDIRYEPSAGSIHQGILLHKVTTQLRQDTRDGPLKLFYHCEGDYYPGIAKLSEFQAQYLYETFARRYFEMGLSSPPFDFKPENYQNVLAQESFFYLGFLPNSQRAQRLDEMRLMVIRFFMEFFSRLQDQESYQALQDQVIKGRDWLDRIPLVTQRWDESLVESTAVLESATEAADALRVDLGLQKQQELEDGKNQLRSLLTDLEQNIWWYELVYSQSDAEATDTPFDMAPEDALQHIDDQKVSLTTLILRLLELSADMGQQQAEIESEFNSRVDMLLSWSDAPPPLSSSDPARAPRQGAPRFGPARRWRWDAPEEPKSTQQ